MTKNAEPPTLPEVETPSEEPISPQNATKNSEPAGDPSPSPGHPHTPASEPEPGDPSNPFLDYEAPDFKFDPDAPDNPPEPDDDAEPEPEPKDKPEAELSKEERKERNRNLRTELERYTREVLPQKEKELETLQTEKQNLEEQLKEAQEKVRSFEERLSTPDYDFDPSKDEELLNEIKPFQDKFAEMVANTKVMGGDADALQKAADPLFKAFLKFNSAQNDQEATEAQEAITDLLGEFPDERKELASLFNSATRKQLEINQRVQEMQKDRVQHGYKKAAKQWSDTHQRFKSEVLDKAFRLDESLAKERPDHPAVIVANMVAGDESVKAKAEQVNRFIEYVGMPLEPLDPAVLADMEPSERLAHQQRRQESYNEAQRQFYAQAPQALMAMHILPSVVRQLREAERRLEAVSESTPRPDGDRKDDQTPEVKSQEDLKSWEPPPFNPDL